MKKLSTREYIAILKGLVEEGHEVGMTVSGTSMSPFLKDNRDEIFFKKPSQPLKAGQMVFYQRTSGQYVMHRICKRNKNLYYMAGDNQTYLEGPIREKQIFAVVTGVKKNGVYLTPDSKEWKFYAYAWRYVFPFRRILKPFVNRIEHRKWSEHD